MAEPDFLALHRRPAGAPPPKIKLYDFKRPDKFSMEQIRMISIMHESFARFCTTTLTDMLRTEAKVHVSMVDQLTFEEFTKPCESNTCLGVVSMRPLTGASVLHIPSALSSAVVDKLYGGAGAKDPAIAPTDLEQSAMRTVFKKLVANLSEAWKPVTTAQFELNSLEKHPYFVLVVPPTEMVVTVTLEVKIGALEGQITLVVPYIVFEPILGKLSAKNWYSSVRRGPAYTPPDGLGDLPIDGEVLLEAAPLSVSQLVELQPGDTIEIPAAADATFRYGGQDLFGVFPTDAAGEFTVDPAEHVRGEALLRQIIGAEPESSGTAETTTEQIASTVQAILGPVVSDIRTELSRIASQQATVADSQMLRQDSAYQYAPRGGATPFDFVRPADAASVALLLSEQHPQIVAMVLAHLEPRVAAAVLAATSETTQPEVVARVSGIEPVSPAILKLTEDFIAERLRGMGAWELQTTGGPAGAGAILNYAPRRLEATVIGTLEKTAPDVAEEIKKRMFVFEDLVLLSPEDLSAVFRESDPEDVAIALKGVDDQVRSRLLADLPEDQRTDLQEAVKSLGRLRLSDVDAAQQRIVETTRELDLSGAIVVARPEETVD